MEPFLGGGAIFFLLNPPQAILSDINIDLIETYTTIREDWHGVWKELRRHQRLHLLKPGYYYITRNSAPRSEIGKAARFIYLNRTCFNGLYRVNLNGEFNVPKGGKDSVIFPFDDFEELSMRIRGATLQQADFEPIVDSCGQGDFAFIDPPYTVKHNLNGFVKYNEHIFSWSDQERLASCLKRFVYRGGKALVMNAAHQSVIDLYQDIGQIHLLQRHSVLASNNSHRTQVEEIAVTLGYSVPMENSGGSGGGVLNHPTDFGGASEREPPRPPPRRTGINASRTRS